ncbi:MAG: sulfatase-like hydrolase/transferase [Polyangiaceae bacterium]
MRPPSNFLIVVCDQWRFHRAFPEHSVRLPVYERLCRNGVELTGATTASMACTPSRAALFTGRLFRETGVWATSGLHLDVFGKKLIVGIPPTGPACTLPPPDRLDNLGSLFRAAGYETYYKGKWHLSDAEGAWPAGPAVGLEEYGFSGWRPPEGHGLRKDRWGLTVDPEYVRDACATLTELKRREAKWLMVVSLVNPHDIGFFQNWQPTIEPRGIELPPNLDDSLADKPRSQRRYRRIWAETALGVRRLAEAARRRRWPSREEMFEDYLQLYGALLEIADKQVGELLAGLEASGQLEDTCVVFTSDHGELGGAHGMMQKWYQAYDEALRVPLVFSNPRLWPAGRSVDALASSIDLVPTLLRLAGIAPRARALPGADLTPILRGERDSVQDSVLFASDDDILATLLDRRPLAIRALRTREWKLVSSLDPESATREFELYDLANDPGELVNLARGPMSGALRERFEALSRDLDRAVSTKLEVGAQG